MTGFKGYLRTSLVAILLGIFVMNATSYAFLFRNEKILRKKARKDRMLTERYKYMYFKKGIVYAPKHSKDKVIDLLK